MISGTLFTTLVIVVLALRLRRLESRFGAPSYGVSEEAKTGWVMLGILVFVIIVLARHLTH